MLDDARIEAVIRQVMAELGQGERRPHAPLPEVDHERPPAPAHALRHGDNLFPDVDSAVAAARQAFEQLMALPLELREQMISHMRRAARENAQLLAREAWEETGLGRLEDKIQKNLLNADKVPGTEILVPTSWTGDHGLTLVEYAPFGVIGAIIPSTNPTSTAISSHRTTRSRFSTTPSWRRADPPTWSARSRSPRSRPPSSSCSTAGCGSSR
jgi:hypothetical protein